MLELCIGNQTFTKYMVLKISIFYKTKMFMYTCLAARCHFITGSLKFNEDQTPNVHLGSLSARLRCSLATS